MKIKNVFTKVYQLEENDVNIVKGALEYCRHRILRHDKCKHLTLESINKLLNDMSKKQVTNIIQYINNIKKPKKEGNKVLNSNENKIEYIMNYLKK